MKHIEQTYTIRAPLRKVWQAFTDPAVIAKWGGGPAVMSEVAGSEFSLWGGDIFGTNTRIVKNKRLEQDWFGGKKWAQASEVVFTFTAANGKTIVKLVQDNVPDDESEAIEQGWKDYYFDPIKELLEAERL